jgi:hypothetical protein
VRLEQVVRNEEELPKQADGPDTRGSGVERGGAIYCLSSASHASICGRRLYLSGVRR